MKVGGKILVRAGVGVTVLATSLLGGLTTSASAAGPVPSSVFVLDFAAGNGFNGPTISLG